MPPANYRVSEPAAVTAGFQALIARATAEGRRALVLAALRYAWAELADAPVHFGESRGRYEEMDLDARIAIVRPVTVEFTIHEPTRQVFIRRVGLGE